MNIKINWYVNLYTNYTQLWYLYGMHYACDTFLTIKKVLPIRFPNRGPTRRLWYKNVVHKGYGMYTIPWYNMVVSVVTLRFCTFWWHLIPPLVFNFIVRGFRWIIVSLLSMSCIAYKRTVCNILHVDDGFDTWRSSVRRTKKCIINRQLVLATVQTNRVAVRLSNFGCDSIIHIRYYNIIMWEVFKF